MINIESCTSYIESLLNQIYYSQMDNIDLAYKLLSETISNKGKILFFGQGHSVWVGKDIKDSYDLPIEVIEDNTDNVEDLYRTNNINKNDCVVIVSNSGINSFIVELAIFLKNKGNRILVINSNKHTFKVDSRHPSKTKLYQYGDVVIDNCCVYGDAAIKDEENYIGSFSSIANNAIMHTVMKKLCNNLNFFN